MEQNKGYRSAFAILLLVCFGLVGNMAVIIALYSYAQTQPFGFFFVFYNLLWMGLAGSQLVGLMGLARLCRKNLEENEHK